MAESSAATGDNRLLPVMMVLVVVVVGLLVFGGAAAAATTTGFVCVGVIGAFINDVDAAVDKKFSSIDLRCSRYCGTSSNRILCTSIARIRR